MSGRYTVFRDHEAVEVLRDDPELLAIADAVAATQAPPRHRRLVRLAVAATVAAAIAVTVSVWPWGPRQSSLNSQALAAIGDGEMIHVRTQSNLTGQSSLDLATGRVRPVVQETEIWFDGKRDLERLVTRVDGRKVDEELDTPDGWWTSDGRVYTCAWILAHPGEAEKAGVSCQSGGEGVAAHRAAEQRPILDPALAGFVNGYRDALKTGAARRVGSGVVDDRPVYWLEFRPDEASAPAGSAQETERVAVDQKTLRPVLVLILVGGVSVSEYRVTTIETLPSDAAVFSRPEPLSPSRLPTSGSLVDSREVTISEAAAALGGLLSPGGTVDGLRLSSVRVETLVNGFAPGSGIPPTRATGVALMYGDRPAVPDRHARYVLVREATGRQLAYGPLPPTRPEPGELLVSTNEVTVSPPETGPSEPTHLTLWTAELVKGGLFVSLEGTSEKLVLDAARLLTPVRARVR